MEPSAPPFSSLTFHESAFPETPSGGASALPLTTNQSPPPRSSSGYSSSSSSSSDREQGESSNTSRFYKGPFHKTTRRSRYPDTPLAEARKTKVNYGRVFGKLLKSAGILITIAAVAALAHKHLIAAITALASLTTPVGWVVIATIGVVATVAGVIFLKKNPPPRLFGSAVPVNNLTN